MKIVKVTRLGGKTRTKSEVSRIYSVNPTKVAKIQQKENFWGASYGDDWERQRRMALQRDGYACTRCGYKPPKHLRHTLQVHHKLSRSRGGKNTLGNLVTRCESCHQLEHPNHDILGGRKPRKR